MTDRDERVAAWLDGTMSEDECMLFEAELERDPALAAQVAAWQDNDALLRAAYDAPMTQAVDEALLARMGLAEKPAPPVAANDNPLWRRWMFPAGGAVAAGLALVFLFGANPRAGQSGSETQFAAAMEELPSRAVRVMAGGGKVSPVLSFAAADGRFCREFAVSGGAQPGGGIACKDGAEWKVEARSASGAPATDPGRIATAGGPDDQELAAAYARLGASDPLSVDAEGRLIASGWKKSR
jgi:hypothetical protein